MSPIQPLSDRELIRALIRLHNTSQGKLVDAAGLVRQNVSSWLTGREDAITGEKKLHLLNTLGVSSGLPRTDMVHRWCVKDIKDVADVLATVTATWLEVSLLNVHIPTHPGSAIVQITDGEETAWIILYRSKMDRSPEPITDKLIGCKHSYNLIIDKAQWMLWLPPNPINLKKFNATLNGLVQRAMLAQPFNEEQGMDKMLVLYAQALKKMPPSEILVRTKLALDL